MGDQLRKGPYRYMKEPESLQEWAGARGLGMTTLALAFTDIVDSTAIGNRLTDSKWIDVVIDHFESAWNYKTSYDGYEIKRIGDAYMAAFRTAADAFQFVWEFAQDAGGFEDKGTEHRILIRAGIHVGQVRIVDDDIYGRMVNYTARIQHLLEGPGIMLSDSAKEDVVAAMGEDPDEFSLSRRQTTIKSFGDRTVWRVHPGRKYRSDRNVANFMRLILFGPRTPPALPPATTTEKKKPEASSSSEFVIQPRKLTVENRPALPRYMITPPDPKKK